jgi:hypothetical protein
VVDPTKFGIGDEHAGDRIVGDGSQQLVGAAVPPSPLVDIEAEVDVESGSESSCSDSVHQRMPSG